VSNSPLVNPTIFQPWTTDVRAWEIAQERFRANEVFWRYGELAALVSMWSVKDFQAGLVQECPPATWVTSWSVRSTSSPLLRSARPASGSSTPGPTVGSRASWSSPRCGPGARSRPCGTAGAKLSVRKGRSPSRHELSPGQGLCLPGDGYRFQVGSWSGSHLASGFETQSHSETAISFVANVAREERPALRPISSRLVPTSWSSSSTPLTCVGHPRTTPHPPCKVPSTKSVSFC